MEFRVGVFRNVDGETDLWIQLVDITYDRSVLPEKVVWDNDRSVENVGTSSDT